MASQIAEQQGFNTKHHAGLGGSAVLWNALSRKELDIYLEYTGTLKEEFKVTPELLESKGFKISKPLGFNNTYALGVKKETAQKLNLQKISDLALHPELIFGMSPEFLDRKEGWRKIQNVYDLPQTKISAIEHEIAYRALASQKIDLTDLYATDAEIAEYNLTTLVDDKKVFPAYDAVFLYRKELETEAPLFISTLKLLENKISDNEMIQMNLEVKVQKKSESEVAQKFLSQLNILSKNTTRSFWQQIYKDTLSHLFLVCISLSFAILVAVPLGVLARFYPKVCSRR
jgi:osmoprotectant transport system permease protein